MRRGHGNHDAKAAGRDITHICGKSAPALGPPSCVIQTPLHSLRMVDGELSYCTVVWRMGLFALWGCCGSSAAANALFVKMRACFLR